MQLATHDPLTGLANRQFMLAHLEQSLRRVQNQAADRFALLYLDFDGFKIINDSLGHLAGDQLLIEIAQRIQALVKDGDTVARMGGDEFAFLLRNLAAQDDLQSIAETILDELSRPFEITGHRVSLTASMGVVNGNGGYLEPDDLLQDAGLAMSEAKAQGKARAVNFDPSFRKNALNRLILESDLRAALEWKEFRLEYQPIICLETHRITGFEALLRWQHPERGLIQPADFLQVVEASDSIFSVTRWVMQEAFTQLRRWQLDFAGHEPLTININLSTKLFTHPELRALVDDCLAEAGLLPGSLWLGVTESVFRDQSNYIQKILEHWHSSGICVQMDDFGMGFSSLHYLRQFPIDRLRIVQPFIDRIREENDHKEVVRAIIALAQDLGMNVVAGGVETETQAKVLKIMGCKYAQGFHFSRPLTPQAARAFLANERLDANSIS